MKTVIYALLISLSVCSALAADFTVECYPIKQSFPFVQHLLDQPAVTHEGKPVIAPYMFCGILTEDRIQEYCNTSETNRKKADSTAILPNGGICHIEFVSKEGTGDQIQNKFKINISGPKTQTVESEITVYPGQALLLRCQQGSDPQKPEIVALKIKKQNG